MDGLWFFKGLSSDNDRIYRSDITDRIYRSDITDRIYRSDITDEYIATLPLSHFKGISYMLQKSWIKNDMLIIYV